MVHIFIINLYSGSQIFADDLRKKLSQYRDLKYFVFNTREAGDEGELVRKILRFFDEEKIRLYCCGGSGTFSNVMNGIDDLSDIEMAYFPCGLTNDFLKSFGENEALFHDIDNLINGKPVLIDYIKTNDGVGLNSFAVGYDQSILQKVDEYRSLSLFGKRMPYIIGFIHGLFLTRPNSFIINTDDEGYEGRTAQVLFMNGCVVGGSIYFAPKADVTNGRAEYYICPVVSLIKTNEIIRTLLKRKYEDYERHMLLGSSEEIVIRRVDGREFSVNIDGEARPKRNEWRARVVHRGLNFVLPKGVSLNE